MRTSIHARLRAVAAGGALIASLGFGLAPASGAPTSSLLYSTDGGATWATSADVAAGGTVLVRQWFDNDGTAPVSDSSIQSTLPAGFTLESASTRVCLNPTTTTFTAPDASELRCASASEGAVWDGDDLTVSPSAGHFGVSSSATSGYLAAGKRRYLNLAQCRYINNSDGYTGLISTAFVTNPTTGASNAAPSGPGCSVAPSGWNNSSSGSVGVTGVQSYELLGQRFVNLHQCRWQQNSDESTWQSWIDDTPDPQFAAGTNTAGVAGAGAPTCGTYSAPHTQSFRGILPFDILTNRYINLHQCGFVGNDRQYISNVAVLSGVASTGSNASNAPDSGTPTCGSVPVGYQSAPTRSGVRAIDTVDTARSAGYVEYSIVAPTAASAEACASDPTVTEETVTQSGRLVAGSTESSSGSLTVDLSAVADPCQVAGVPLADPLVGAGAALAAVAAGAVVLGRRRRNEGLAA